METAATAERVDLFPCEDQNWRAGALCAERDPDLFFSPGALEHKIAKRICRDCPVRRQCLAYAMTAPVDHGIWGGLTERERRRFRRVSGPDWRAKLAVADLRAQG